MIDPRENDMNRSVSVVFWPQNSDQWAFESFYGVRAAHDFALFVRERRGFQPDVIHTGDDQAPRVPTQIMRKIKIGMVGNTGMVNRKWNA